jgi:ABC-type transport system involved in multi-copper enzyme maturation, permease component
MNVYRHELKWCRKAASGWTLALSAIAAAMLAMYPSFAKEAEALRVMLSTMPEEMLKAFGVELDSIASLVGFYSYIFLYVSLCGAIQAMHLGASILSKETREKTADFLLVKPVSRGSVALSKILAALTVLVSTNAVYMAAAGGMAQAVRTEPFDAAAFYLISFSLLLIQLIFLSLGLAAAMLFPRMKSVLPVSLGGVFGFFALGMIASSAGDGAMRALTPLYYFDRAYTIARHGYEPEYLALGGAVALLCTAFAYWRYVTRDVYVG